jgi:hypothetical protein
MASLCMFWMSRVLYSLFFSYVSSMVFLSSFCNNRTISSTDRDVTSSREISRAFFLTSKSGEDKIRRTSITRSSRTPSFFLRSAATRSKTMSLTLLSGSLIANSMNLLAAALTATCHEVISISLGCMESAITGTQHTGFDVRVQSDAADSYTTVDVFASSKSNASLCFVSCCGCEKDNTKHVPQVFRFSFRG